MNQRIGGLGIGLLAVFPFLGGCFGQSTSLLSVDGGEPHSFEASLGDSSTSPSAILGVGSVIDFGFADCGGVAPAPQTFTIGNGGGATSTLHYSLSLSPTTVFQMDSATSGDVVAGTSATAVIAANAVAQSATAGQVDQATLTIVTDDPTLPMTLVTLRRTAHGATLTLSPATAAFGDVSVGAVSQATALTLTNTGNEVATVAIGVPTAPQFALTWAGTVGVPVLLAPNGAVPMLGATFAPVAAGAASATSALTPTGAVCGASVSSISMTGNGTKGAVAVTPGTLDFQDVDCGQTAPPQTVKISNTGGASFDFNAILAGGATSPFTVSPSSGAVGPNASVTVTVTPNAIPAVASVTANAFGDILQITSNLTGDANHDVSLTQTARGAVLALDKTSIPFGDVSVLQNKTAPFNVTNTGTLPATVSLQVTGLAFEVLPAAATTLTVGGSPLAGNVTFRPTTVGSQAGSIALSTLATNVVCSAPIGPIGLSGEGINGTLSLSTNTIDFQSVACEASAAPQSFTITNTGGAAFTWSAALGKGAASLYQLSPSAGSLAPGAVPTTVVVTPAAIPYPSALTPNLYGDTITVTPTGIAGGSPQTIALTETAKGAVITVTPSPFPPFASQPEGQASAPGTLTVTNIGTMPATLTPSIAGANASSFSLATRGAKSLAVNGGSYSPGPTFDPQTTGALTAQVVFASGANEVLCQPLPAPVPLSGLGTNGSITLGATALTILAQPCGATAGLTQTLRLTNSGTASLTWTASVLGAGGFSVLPTTGSLAGGGAFTTVTVTGPTFASTRGNVTPVTGTLRVTTTAFGDGNHDVALSSTPSGAILAWGTGLTGFAFGTVQATTGGTRGKNLPLSITNDGDVAAPVSFALEGATTFTFAPQNTTVAGNGGVLTGSATFDPTSSGGQLDTVNVTVPAGTRLCAPLPAALPISGSGAQGTFTSGATGLAFELTCNAQAASQTFTVNDSPAVVPYDFTATLGAGWKVTPALGTVNPNTPFSLAVTPPAIGAGTPGASNNTAAEITTDIPSDVVHGVAIDGMVVGASLAFLNPSGAPQPTLSFGSTFRGTGTGTTLLENSGNAAASVHAVVTPSSSNADFPSTSLLFINSVAASTWTTSAGTGATTVVYSFSAAPPCGNVYTYTVTIPSTLDGVCAGTTQTVTITAGDSC